jgi:hypothetical protein
MKNFLDIMATDTVNQLVVDIQLVEHHNPQFCFFVNEARLDNKCRSIYLDLMEPIKFACEIKTGAIEITKLSINGNEVLPQYQHLANPATNWITENWSLLIPGPFYPWYHAITGQGWTA